MDRCPAPWSETPPPPLPTPPQQQSSVQNQTADDQQAASHHCDPAADGSPTTHRGSRSPSSPSGPAPPDALQFAYSTTVEQPVENMTVIRGHRSLSPEHSPAGEPLVYQTLGDSPGFLNQYGISYTNFSPTPTSSSQVGTSSAYNYVKGYQGDIIQMVPGYDNDSPRAMSPSGSVLYTLQYPAQDVTHSNAHPMWGAAVTNNNGSGYPFSSGLGSPSLETNDVGTNGRSSYSAFTGNPAYMLASGNETAAWATLPSITSSYLPDSRRSQYTEPPPEYSRIPEPPQHQCAVCGGTDSSPWRRDSTGQFICNSCAIYKNGVTARSNAMRPARRLTTSRRAGMTCSNCSTTDTTLWRRNTQGEPVCNACGLYYKLHQVNRPITMRKDSIQTRKRKPKSSASAAKGKAHTTNSNTNGSSKSPSATSTSVSSAASYLPQGGMDGDLSDAQHHRLVQSPLLPSSTALSQQLPQFPPLDPPHGSEIILENGIVLEHPSVISVAPNKQL